MSGGGAFARVGESSLRQRRESCDWRTLAAYSVQVTIIPGVRLGVFQRIDASDYSRSEPPQSTGYNGPRVRLLQIPYEAISDAAWLYVISVPLFAIASLFEFMM